LFEKSGMPSEGDTCRKEVLPKLYAAGWNDDQINEQRSFTDGRIVVAGTRTSRKPQKRADYLLRYGRDFMIAVVEAKASYKNSRDGLQQAKEYARILDIQFAYSTNGREIVEQDFLTGKETDLRDFPSPVELWDRLQKVFGPEREEERRFLSPSLPVPEKPLRYYQEIAVNRAVQAVLKGRKRLLLNMATGNGKTDVAFHICWKKKGVEGERAWKVPAKEILANNCNLDRKNPSAKEDIAHLPPEVLAKSILEGKTNCGNHGGDSGITSEEMTCISMCIACKSIQHNLIH
jgi:hypothetical protein